jgi:DNA-binding NtrC family response regulator
LAGQVKLLRVLETGRFQRLGSNREKQVKVRIISATNADLPTMIRAGQFREDLYYRLNVIQLNLPALADRPEDILPLAQAFLDKDKQLDANAKAALLAHTWPGNVRELKNLMHRAQLLARGEQIGVGDLGLPAAPALRLSSDAEPDKAAVESALLRAHGVIAQAASALGLSRQSLYRRMDRFGIARPGQE